MGVTVAAVTVGSLLIGEREAKKREKRQNEAMERERRVHSAEQAYKARQETRRQIREARVKQAQVESLAQAQGTTGSSAAVAAKDSLSAQLGSNVGDINTAVAFAQGKSAAAMDVHKAGQKNDLERIAGLTASVSSQFIGS